MHIGCTGIVDPCITHGLSVPGVRIMCVHLNENIVILTKFSLSVTLEVVTFTIFSEASDGNFMKMKTVPFQYFWHGYIYACVHQWDYVVGTDGVRVHTIWWLARYMYTQAIEWCNWHLFTWWRHGMVTQKAKLMGPTWGPPGSCRSQMPVGSMLAPWTLLSGNAFCIAESLWEVTGWFRSKRAIKTELWRFFVVNLTKLLNKQSSF